jgi:hypothetical protein
MLSVVLWTRPKAACRLSPVLPAKGRKWRRWKHSVPSTLAPLLACCILPWLAAFWLPKRAPQDRYRVVYEESGLPLILFQYPDVTKATYNLETMLDISAQPGSLR